MIRTYLSSSICTLIIDHNKMEHLNYDIVAQLSTNKKPPYNLLGILNKLPHSHTLPFTNILQDIPSEILPTTIEDQPYTILMPIAELSQRYTLQSIFQIIYYYKKTKKIHQVFLWLNVKNISDEFLLPYLEYLSSGILIFKDSINLSLLMKRGTTGGSTLKKLYSYSIENDGISVNSTVLKVTEVKKEIITTNKIEELTINPESLATFKINMDDEEMVARNALILPYEKTSDKPVNTGGKIIYNPDADDDFDEEDPDDDLNI